jgi:transcriptional regulator with XRE-family HTH domain
VIDSGNYVRRKISPKATSKSERVCSGATSLAWNGHTVPAIETLEKMARAFEVPMYQLFYDGEEPPKLPNLPKRKSDEDAWGSTGKDARFLNKLRRLLGKTDEDHRKLLLHMTQKMAHR